MSAPTSSSSQAPSTDNPLFLHEAPPRFDLITPAHVVPAIRALIERQDQARTALEASVSAATAAGETLTWDALPGAMSGLAEPLSYAWGVVHHLLSVKNTPELRAAEEEVQPEVIAASLRLGQSQAFYKGLVALRAGAGWGALDEAQRRIVDSYIQQAELAGVGLEGAARERFNQIETELGESSTRFENNLIDATKAFALVLRDRADVEGLPASALAAAAQSARNAAAGDAAMAAATPDAGPWRITLDTPSYLPFMENSRRRDLRERLYRALVTRASSGAHDNGPLVDKTLRLRREEANTLGFASFAELSLRRKMAKEVTAVDKLLGDLRRASRPQAERELAELTAFARKESSDPTLTLALWDIAFWAERMRERLYAFSDEELRPYFPLPAVLQGLFGVATRLFGVTITPADGEVPVWNPDVRFFRVTDEKGAPVASFFLDSYSRPADKRGGAWMSGCLDRKRRADGSLRLPVTYVVCNQAPPVDGKPSLMTFREVETLFHEFGHALHHMLTRVDYVDAAGTNNVEWDAVELPSQFMENWCYHRPTLLSFARHFETGEPLPTALYEKISAARTYRAGSMFLRQIHFATLDLELHHRFQPGRDDMPATIARVIAENTVLPPLPEDRFLCSFSHIFAGGYAAGYYSYKWAEVLSADAFAAFEEAGLEDEQALAKTGRRFRDTVLALGGGRHPADVFQDFRGRAPTTDALLRHNGLSAA